MRIQCNTQRGKQKVDTPDGGEECERTSGSSSVNFVMDLVCMDKCIKVQFRELERWLSS